MRKAVFVLLSMLFFVYGFRQESVMIIKNSSPGFAADQIGNLYFFRNQEIIKYKADGTYFNRFSDKSMGAINALDVTNPLKILVMNKDLAVIFFLDNMLGKSTAEVDLNELSVGNASLACSSYNNGFWLFNPVDIGIRRYDENLKLISDVHFLNQIIREDIQPCFMREYANQLFLSDSTKGIYVFDIFGTYLKKIPIAGISEFQVLDGKLVFNRTGYLHMFHLSTLQEDSIPYPDSRVQKMVLGRNLLYAKDTEGVRVYPLKPGGN